METAKFTLMIDNDYIIEKYPIVSYFEYKNSFFKQKGVSRCPGLMEYHRALYVLPMWFDLKISKGDEPNSINFEHNEWWEKFIQMQGGAEEVSKHFGKDYMNVIFKLITPWYFKLPKDHALILRSLDFNFGDKFYPFSGLVYDASPRINIPMLLNLEKKPIMIRAGDPLVLLEIVNVKNVPKLEMVHQSDKEMISYWKKYLDSKKEGLPNGSLIPTYNKMRESE